MKISCIKKIVEKPIAISIALTILTIFIIFLVLNKSVDPVIQPDNEMSIVHKQLMDLEDQLGNLAFEVKKSAKPLDLNTINQEIKHLSEMLEKNNLKGDEEISQLFSENHIQLTQKLDGINQIVNQLSKTHQPIQYLEINALPFTVLSIDSIQQIPVASVMYDFKTIPLEVKDSLAGWIVINLNFGKQQIEFENTKKEHVIVVLGEVDVAQND